MSSASIPLNPSSFDDPYYEEEQPSVETRNRAINLHHRPGFYSKALLGSVGLNAVLLMACAWLSLRVMR